MKKLWILLATLLLTPLVAGLYGMLHDQLSYTLSAEYFTRFKFIQFRLEGQLDKPYRLLAAIVVASIGAAVLGIFSIRTSGVYFMMLTLALAQMLFSLAQKWDFTGSSDGVTFTRPEFSLFGFSLRDLTPFYLFVLGAFVVCFLVLTMVIRSPFGQAGGSEALEGGLELVVRLERVEALGAGAQLVQRLGATQEEHGQDREAVVLDAEGLIEHVAVLGGAAAGVDGRRRRAFARLPTGQQPGRLSGRRLSRHSPCTAGKDLRGQAPPQRRPLRLKAVRLVDDAAARIWQGACRLPRSMFYEVRPDVGCRS